MMLEKGLKYKENAKKKREEKSLTETDGCSFTPKVNKIFNKTYKDPTVAMRYNHQIETEKVYS